MAAYDDLRASWTALGEATCAEIEARLVAAVHARLGEVPAVDVLGVVARRVHFIAHRLDYHDAQSGSDWANHYVVVGDAPLDGVGAVHLTEAVDATIREADWNGYRASRVVEEVRDQTLVKLGVTPPAPKMERITVVRCPQCGATDAGAIEFMYEIVTMACGVCGHTELVDDEQIKDDWNVKYDRRADERDLPAFVPPLPPALPGFDLRGERSDEVRLLVHPGLGFALAVPGMPRWEGPAGTQSALLDAGVWVSIVVRTHGYYTTSSLDELLRREIEAAARRRAKKDSALELVAAPVPPGGSACMSVTYPREDDTETLTVALGGEHPYPTAVFTYVRYPPKHVNAFAAANLRAALSAHQTWVRGELPSMDVWPAGGAFSTPQLSLGSTKRGSDAARAKAELLVGMSDSEAQRVREVLLREASMDDPPHRPWTAADTRRVAERIPEILARDLGDVQSMHDFRAWCRDCTWVVDNRRRR